MLWQLKNVLILRLNQPLLLISITLRNVIIRKGFEEITFEH